MLAMMMLNHPLLFPPAPQSNAYHCRVGWVPVNIITSSVSFIATNGLLLFYITGQDLYHVLLLVPICTPKDNNFGTELTKLENQMPSYCFSKLNALMPFICLRMEKGSSKW